jgi:predicted transcriptional regulator
MDKLFDILDRHKNMYYFVIQWRCKMSQTMTVRIPDDLSKDLKEISKKEGIPISNLVRESLKKYVMLYRFRKLREMVLPFAEAQGILTDEDVYKQIS